MIWRRKVGMEVRMFKLSYGTHLEQEVIGIYETADKARAEMIRRLKDEGVEPCYYRQVGEENDCFIDFGSWSRYYFIKKI